MQSAVAGQALKQQSWRKRKRDLKQRKEEKLLCQLAEAKRLKDEEAVVSAPRPLPVKPGRSFTVSIALPGAILESVQSPELRAYVAGQISRAACIFNVDEIVIYDETALLTNADLSTVNFGKQGYGNALLARLLQYAECPQYLRKQLFPLDGCFKFVGLMNTLDAPHHLRANDLSLPYREAIVLSKPTKADKGSFVDAGLRQHVRIDRVLEAGQRVTVMLDSLDQNQKKLQGKVVSPHEPCRQLGIYWGYRVRVAASLGAVFTDCPFSVGKYDLTIGTSEHGADVHQITQQQPKKFKHALIVFGGWNGLELALEADQHLTADDPSQLFDYYVNTCLQQGSRNIRTEEAILITLSTLQCFLTER